MQVNFTGHGLDVTPALRDYMTGKLEKIERHALKVTSMQVILGVEKLNQIAEAIIHVPGSEIHARAQSEDMYSAIDMLIDKLDRQVIKHKQKATDHRD